MITYQPFEDGRYQTLQDFLDAVAQPVRNAANQRDYNDFMVDSHYGDWLGAGCDTGQDVARLVRDGWPEGRDRLQEFRSKLGEVMQPIDRKRRLVRGASGDTLDMPTVWGGRLDIAWRAPRRTVSRAPARVDIVANMICCGGDHADVLFWRGAAAVALADILESAGYMVRLVVAFGGAADYPDGYGKAAIKTSCRITVKDHGAPLDVTSTSAVILPGFFRALGHAWIQNHAKHERDMGGIQVGSGIIEQDEIVLSHSVFDHATALTMVNSVIETLNAEAAA